MDIKKNIFTMYLCLQNVYVSNDGIKIHVFLIYNINDLYWINIIKNTK